MDRKVTMSFLTGSGAAGVILIPERAESGLRLRSRRAINGCRPMAVGIVASVTVVVGGELVFILARVLSRVRMGRIT